MHLLIGLAGILLILAIAFALSSNRRAIRLRVVGAAFLLQAGIALLVLYVPAGRAIIAGMSHGVANLLGYAQAGTNFIFGPLAKPEIGGASFAIAALPVIIFFASLVSILYYLGIMQFIVRWVGGAIEKVTGVSKVESLCAAANIFVGQSESPLVIRPYLAGLNGPQLFAVMTSGMAGVAGTILAAYASMGIKIDYLLAASFMAAPGGLLMAKIMMPDEPECEPELPLEDDIHLPETRRAAAVAAVLNAETTPGEPMPVATHDEEKPANIIMAAAQGAQTGVKLAVAVGAMVLAFVALVALANGILGWLGGLAGYPDLSFQQILGTVFAPMFYLLGSPTWAEAMQAGGLFGTKIVLNEFVAFIELGQDTGLSKVSVALVTFALCGFANFSSIAIQIGGIGGLAPERRSDLARFGLRAVLGGTIATLMTATIAGVLSHFG